MAPKKQKTQHLSNTSLPPGDGCAEVAVEEEEEYNVDDPMNEDGKEEPLIKESSSSKSSQEIQEMEYCNMVNLAREKVDSNSWWNQPSRSTCGRESVPGISGQNHGYCPGTRQFAQVNDR